MKILFLSFFFPPYNTIGSIRTGKTAKILSEYGNDLIVIAGKEDSLSKDLPIEISSEKVYYVEYKDINDILSKFVKKDKGNLKSFVLYNSSRNGAISKLMKLYRYVLYTPDKYITWYFPALKKAEEIIIKWKPDLIFASAMPFTSLLVASTLSKKYNIPYIAELRDLWVDNHYFKQNFVGKYMEKIALSRAKAIITVSEPLAEKIRHRYEKPVYVIHNAFDEEDYIGFEEEYFKSKNKIIITYTGTIYHGKRDPTTLFKAISIFPELREKIICKFYGVENKFVLQELAKEYNLTNNIEIYDKVSRAESLKIQKKSDILLLLTWNHPMEKGVYTGKLFEYIGSAKPILAIGNVDNVAAELINKYGFGLATNNIEAIREFILNFDNYKEAINMNYKSYRYLFERKYQVRKLIEIFENHL